MGHGYTICTARHGWIPNRKGWVDCRHSLSGEQRALRGSSGKLDRSHGLNLRRPLALDSFGALRFRPPHPTFDGPDYSRPHFRVSPAGLTGGANRLPSPSSAICDRHHFHSSRTLNRVGPRSFLSGRDFRSPGGFSKRSHDVIAFGRIGPPGFRRDAPFIQRGVSVSCFQLNRAWQDSKCLPN
jgi:hypothetical protein